ncbi:hypothetical protein K2173_010319 [Erythroxylum novogranatense]|uniref:Zinc finger PHD-type domain-containing protein n=1 Tax=Erythroxylum novogranatense TaxID=1862640 RepID=A0AAV8TFA2_9ROSI|nr:hypothetical protein K2173_010319 [Erythroxylum novogranatense]
MKGGLSNRLQSHHHPHDDWIDGSWTVDCVCGVNFDDGEEMVNCDDCGVWVHTRCSGYVKGDDLFTCDKCKSTNNIPKETEVAQLLVELPTKAIPMDTSSAASRRPFRLWTHRPMEDRVHVQGIPGGDSALFSGLSSVFSSELWKCTGYVPKKFNFQYREFPCWDENNNGDRVHQEEALNSVLTTSATSLIGLRSEHNEEGCDKKDDDVRHQQIGVNKERSLLGHVMVPSGKKRREDWGSTKDIPSGKKKATAIDKDEDMTKRNLHASASYVCNGKRLALYEDRSLKSFKSNSQCTQNENLRDPLLQGPESGKNNALGSGAEKPRNNFELSWEALSFDMSKYNSPIFSGSEEGVRVHSLVVVAVHDESAKAMASPILEHAYAGKSHGKLEGDSVPNVNLDGNIEVYAARNQTESGDDMYPSSSFVISNLKVDVDNTDPAIVLNSLPSMDYSKDGMVVDNKPEIFKMNGAQLSGSTFIDHRAEEVGKTSEAIGDYYPDKAQELTSDSCQAEQELDGAEGAVPMQNCSSEAHLSSGFTEELSISSGTNLSFCRLPSQHRMVTGKSYSFLVNNLKSSISENFRAADTMKSTFDPKQVVLLESDIDSRKDQVTTDVCSDEDQIDKARSHISLCKRTVSEAKYSLLHSSKAPLVQSSDETAGSIQNEWDSLVQNRVPSSALPSRSEKLNYFGSQSQSKANHAMLLNSSTAGKTPAALSDVDIALLLHQVLNSSPRVPHVRVAGSLMQLASPTADNMLAKCTSSSGGKDYGLIKRQIRVPSLLDWKRLPDTGYLADMSSKSEGNSSPTPIHSINKNVPAASTSISGQSSFSEVNDHQVSYVLNSPRTISDEETGTVHGCLINEIMNKGKHITYLPHWHNLRKHNGEHYAYASHSQAVLDCLRKQHEWAKMVDRDLNINSSRKGQKLDTEDSEDTDYDDVRAQENGENYPVGKRKERKGRRLELQGRGIKRPKSDSVTGGSFAAISNSIEESMFGEDEIQGCGGDSVGMEASAGSHDAE